MMAKAKRRTLRRPQGDGTAETGALPELPATGLLRIAQVLKYVPISRTSWWLGVREGRFPQPQKLGNVPVWRVTDIRDLINHGERPPSSPPVSPAVVHATG
jgi:predicted DNA-binding transcriptional regulator AlpA